MKRARVQHHRSRRFYIVEVKVTDTFDDNGLHGFQYTLLDTDNDWSSSCSSDTWFDPNTGKSCGPNIDQDDDNDGFSDEKAAFPLDPCAQLTPTATPSDELDCPEVTSWLTEDVDDDGDGTPDSSKGPNLKMPMWTSTLFLSLSLSSSSLRFSSLPDCDEAVLEI